MTPFPSDLPHKINMSIKYKEQKIKCCATESGDAATKTSCILFIHFHSYSRLDFNLAEFKDFFYPSFFKRAVTGTNTPKKTSFEMHPAKFKNTKQGSG